MSATRPSQCARLRGHSRNVRRRLTPRDRNLRSAGRTRRIVVHHELCRRGTSRHLLPPRCKPTVTPRELPLHRINLTRSRRCADFGCQQIAGITTVCFDASTIASTPADHASCASRSPSRAGIRATRVPHGGPDAIRATNKALPAGDRGDVHARRHVLEYRTWRNSRGA